MIGQPRRSVPLFEMHNSLQEEKGEDLKNLAVGLGNVAMQQLVIGSIRKAECNLRHRIDLCRKITDKSCEAIGHWELGRVLSYRGEWREAEQELTSSLNLFEKHDEFQSQSIVLAYQALHVLLMVRANPHFNNQSLKSAIQSTSRAIELANYQAIGFPTPRDYKDAYWLLGAAHRANNDLQKAEKHLSEVLTRDRNIDAVDTEANILLDLARLRYTQEKPEEAKTLAEEALLITERCGYVLQGADVHLFLAQYALEQGKDKTRAKELATCDGPPYYYKVAYEEAKRFLEKLNK